MRIVRGYVFTVGGKWHYNLQRPYKGHLGYLSFVGSSNSWLTPGHAADAARIHIRQYLQNQLACPTEN